MTISISKKSCLFLTYSTTFSLLLNTVLCSQQAYAETKIKLKPTINVSCKVEFDSSTPAALQTEVKKLSKNCSFYPILRNYDFRANKKDSAGDINIDVTTMEGSKTSSGLANVFGTPHGYNTNYYLAELSANHLDVSSNRRNYRGTFPLYDIKKNPAVPYAICSEAESFPQLTTTINSEQAIFYARAVHRIKCSYNK